MENITHSQLKDKILNEIKGATFISLRTVTKQNSLNKGGKKVAPMFESLQINPDTIKKYSNIVGLLSGGDVSYQDFVNNRLTKEAKELGKEKAQLTFEAGPRTWGTRINNAIVEYDGKYYLTLYCMANNKPIVTYKYNGKLLNINDSKFDPWRKPEKKEGDNQGTKNPIIVKDFSFENIKEITFNKNTYSVIPN